MRDQLQQYVCAVSLRLRSWTLMAFAVCLVIGVSASRAEATMTISGTGPFTIYQDTKLVGDVNCSGGGNCITFGAPDIELNLNGFTITGPASANCIPNPFVFGFGIFTEQADSRIQGPGKVQKFTYGVALGAGGDRSKVQDVVAIRNCSAGIAVNSNGFEISDDILLSTIRGQGIFVFLGSNGEVRENEVHGNGGEGILVCSTGNEIEENSVTGNTDGIRLGGASSCGTLAISTNTTVDENLVLGNRGFGTDIEDLGTNNTVTKKNVCETGTGAAATVCAISPTPAFDIDHEVERPKKPKK